jgi:hypothetical protein
VSLLSTVAVLLLETFVFQSAAAQQQSASVQTFNDPTTGIKANYPAGWVFDTSESDAALAADPEYP